MTEEYLKRLKNKLTCIICGKELVRNQQKYCSVSHRKRRGKRRKWRIINAKEKTGINDWLACREVIFFLEHEFFYFIRTFISSWCIAFICEDPPG